MSKADWGMLTRCVNMATIKNNTAPFHIWLCGTGLAEDTIEFDHSTGGYMGQICGLIESTLSDDSDLLF